MALAQVTSPPQYLQYYELVMNQECKELLPSLPKEKGVLFSYFYNYQGYWYSPYELQGVIPYQKHFEAKDDDILLVTNPKSGTTWLKAIVFTLVNRREYDINNPQHPLRSKNSHEVIRFIDLEFYRESPNPDLSCIKSPRLFSTHLPFISLSHSVQASACKIVYLCRNPKDIFVSLYHFTNKLRRFNKINTISLENVFDLFCRGVSDYGPCWDHILGYWQKSLELPDRVLFLKYEDLKQQPVIQLKKLAKFLDCPFSAEEERSGLPEEIVKFCSFDNLSNLDVNKKGKLSNNGFDNKAFFRQGEIGDSNNFLTAEMIKRLDDLAKEKFHAFGLEL